MFEPAKISNAFLTESRLDLLSAKLLFDKEIYSRAVYFAQQSSEKAIRKSSFVLDSLEKFIKSQSS
ncbi:MAG: HEPN domain-containing protein [Candidatus Methanoperedens sp.]|nr:HEPN domain-containing protein [Candidatus Methanoperedens sp.]